jgi:PDZ domain-containing secreted protein
VLVVRVELWSAITGAKTELARMIIHNVGVSPDKKKGDYKVVTLRGRSKDALDKSMTSWWHGDKSNITREGEVKGHSRLSKHVWNLVAKALKGVKYG